MDYREFISNTIDYIEDRLKDDISTSDVTKAMGFSKYHYHRIFQSFTNFSIYDYIRKRKLTEAALLLKTSNQRIIDIAFGFSYNSQEAFSRAFKQEFGITPAKFRRYGYALKYYPRVKLDKEKKGVVSIMEPKFVVKEGFKVLGYSLRVSSDNGENFKKIPEFWTEVMSKGMLNDIPNKVNNSQLGICCNYDPETNEFDYIIGCEVDSFNGKLGTMIEMELPSVKYAVFAAKGMLPHGVQSTTRYIFGTWLPDSDYDHLGTPDFELYDERCTNDENCEVDIYLPVERM